jgi:thiazole synthase ThiGH ThiG subunit
VLHSLLHQLAAMPRTAGCGNGVEAIKVAKNQKSTVPDRPAGNRIP